jgi:hypothetical protein
MNAQTVVGKEVVNVSKDLGNLIGGVIQSLAEKLSVPVSQVYDVLRTQMIIEGWCFMIITVTIILILATVMKVSSKYEFLVDDNRGSYDPTRWFFIFTFSLISCFTSICIFICYFTESLSKILNPDYYVLQTITEMAKGIIAK